MTLIQNFPFFSLMLPMIAGVVSSVLSGKKARVLGIAVNIVLIFLSVGTLLYVRGTGESYNYMMGHFPAPWGNEIRVGALETLLAAFFLVIILLSVIGGMTYTTDRLDDRSLKLYFVFLNLLTGSILAMIYTNDLFTAYVFIEINTIASCGLIVAKRTGPVYVAATRYMIMSLLGSGLFLISVCMLYTVTGHLLMENIRDRVLVLTVSGEYRVPVLMVIVLMSAGLAIKSGLFPFHSWMPSSYGFSLPTSSAILSGVVSKSYIFLLIKIIYRVMRIQTILGSGIEDILFIFSILAIIGGSLMAIREKDIRYMNAYSSVAQIGYVYLGISLGNFFGVVAAIFHMMMHAATKSLLFLATEELSQVSRHKHRISAMRGAGFRAKISGLGFAVGAFSMVGIPFFAGFISKLALASAASEDVHRIVIVLLVLAVSTLLNAMYFIRTVLVLFTRTSRRPDSIPIVRTGLSEKAALVILIAINFALGIFSSTVIDIIRQGLTMFS